MDSAQKSLGLEWSRGEVGEDERPVRFVPDGNETWF